MTHVLVVSDRQLVAESVVAAMSALGLRATLRPWPEDVPDGVDAGPVIDLELARGDSTGGLRADAKAPDVGVMVSDLEATARLAQALHALHSVPTRWVVLTEAAKGPLWGAVLDAGAVAVLEDDTTLDDLAETLRAVAAGREVISREEANQLRHAWRAVRAEQRTLVDRMLQLSPREAVVLGMLYAGEPVREIAEDLGVSEATVRSQVRAVLRKLDVNSQLAAVAAYAAVREELIRR